MTVSILEIVVSGLSSPSVKIFDEGELAYCNAQRFEYSAVASKDGQAFGAKSE